MIPVAALSWAWGWIRVLWPVLLALGLAVLVWARVAAYGAQKFEAGAESVQAAWNAEKLDGMIQQAVRAGFADAIHARTREAAITIQTETRAETAAALGRIEDAIEQFGASLPDNCPRDVPASVRDEGRKAVAAARAAGEVRPGKAGARAGP